MNDDETSAGQGRRQGGGVGRVSRALGRVRPGGGRPSPGSAADAGAAGAAGAETPPPPEVPPPPQGRGRGLRLLGWLVAIGLALVVGAYVVWSQGPPTETELRDQAGLMGRQELLIGVKDDTPGVAWRDPKTGKFQGFDIQIAYLVAADLGFTPDRVRFLAIETEDRQRRRAREADGRTVSVDLVVASFSITAERAADTDVSFSAPYLETEQTVVTRADHGGVSALQQLQGEKVCTLGTSTSQTTIDKVNSNLAPQEKMRITPKNEISECIAGLKNKTYDAVTTDAAILVGFVAESKGRLKSHDIGLETTEKWGINSGGNKALQTLVDLALYRSYADPQDQRWEKAFSDYLAPLQPANPNQDVAKDRQPSVKEPDVRRWPWERALPRP